MAAALHGQSGVNQMTMEQEMPTPQKDTAAARPAPALRWLASVLRASVEPVPALPFERGNRRRPAAFSPLTPSRSGAVAAR
jgi:hypothetical protein